MNRKEFRPGVSREQRLSDEGLARLERQLGSGINVSKQVLAQWIKRYGEPARKIIRRHRRYCPELEKFE